jgi:hypothetical protein
LGSREGGGGGFLNLFYTQAILSGGLKFLTLFYTALGTLLPLSPHEL